MQSLVDLCALVLKRYPRALKISLLPEDLKEKLFKKLTNRQYIIREIDEVTEAIEYFKRPIEDLDNTFFQKALLLRSRNINFLEEIIDFGQLVIVGVNILFEDSVIDNSQIDFLIKYLKLEVSKLNDTPNTYKRFLVNFIDSAFNKNKISTKKVKIFAKLIFS